jgi:iron complex outermembrane receptor protein
MALGTLAKRLSGACLLASLVALGGAAAEPPRDLTQLSLDDLVNLEVTSVSKKPEKSSEVAAASYIITNEDIRRSGAESIADALRLAPGVHVASIDAHTSVVSVRGFSNQLSNKLLVLIDGRSVYTPLFGGVFWDVQDTMLEDVDRIEVIRGPGGTLWGANAVNGVVNVITKSAKETQGGLVVAQGGSQEHGLGEVRYGGNVGEDFSYRVYGKYFNRDGGFLSGADENDDWQMGRAGFRTDWDAAAKTVVTVQGDYYEGRVGPFQGPELQGHDTVQGANVLGRFTRGLDGGSEITLQSYYDHTFRSDAFFSERRDTGDLDFQYRVPLPWQQEAVWGANYRVSDDHVVTPPTFQIVPDSRTVQLYSFFLEDEVTLLDGALKATVGNKFEHDDFSGWEFQPSGRIAWTPLPKHTLWASASRAVRAISRVENDLGSSADPSSGVATRFLGSRQLEPEEMVAYEAGYRFPVSSELHIDVATFYDDYRHAVTDTLEAPTFDPARPTVPVVPLRIANRLDGQIYGAELAADAQVTSFWRLRASYSYLRLQMRPSPGDADTQQAQGSSPQNQFSFRSLLNLPAETEIDTIFRYVDNLPTQHVGHYFNLDVHISRGFGPHLELAVVAQNLLSPHHREFAGGTEVERSAYGKVSWRF